MALVPRISGSEGEKIRVHPFTASLHLLGLGEITKAQIVSAFSLNAGEEATLDEVITYYQGLTQSGKDLFYMKLEAASVLLEEGFITESFYKSLFSLT